MNRGVDGLQPQVTATATATSDAAGTAPDSNATTSVPSKPGFVMQRPNMSQDNAANNETIRQAAKRLFATVATYRTVDANGSDHEKRVAAQRQSVVALLAKGRGAYDLRARLLSLGPQVEADLKQARSDQADPNPTQFSPNHRQATAGESGDLHQSGARAYFDQIKEDAAAFYAAPHGNLLPLLWSKDPTLHAQVCLDLSLRGCDGAGVVDASAPAPGDLSRELLAEQKSVLANLTIPVGRSPSDALARRELALLRLVLGTAPYVVIDAADEMHRIWLRLSRCFVEAWPDQAWISQHESHATADIERFIVEKAYTNGPKEKRLSTFFGLARILGLAAAGDKAGAYHDLCLLAAQNPTPELVELRDGIEKGDSDFASQRIRNHMYWCCEAKRTPKGGMAELIHDVMALHGLSRSARSVETELGERLLAAGEAIGPVAGAYRRLLRSEPTDGVRQDLAAAAHRLPQTLDTLTAVLDQLRAANADDATDDSTQAVLNSLTQITAALSQHNVELTQSAAFINGVGSAERLALQNDLIAARAEVLEAFGKCTGGAARLDLLQIDLLLEHAANKAVANSCAQIGTCDTPHACGEALAAVHNALLLTRLSNVDALYDPDDPMATLDPSLDQVIADVAALLPSPGEQRHVAYHEFRRVMAEVIVLCARVEQNLAALTQAREKKAARAGIELAKPFVTEVLSRTALVSARALAEKARWVGAPEEIGHRYIKNIRGLSSLVGFGPVVFSQICFVDSLVDLNGLKIPSTALAVVKKIDANAHFGAIAGGVAVNAADADAAQEELGVLARATGMDLLAFPDLDRYRQFLMRAQNEHGLFVTEEDGELSLMTVDFAIALGVLDRSRVSALMPGANTEVRHLQPDALSDKPMVVREQQRYVGDRRPTRLIEIALPGDAPKNHRAYLAPQNPAAVAKSMSLPLARGLFGDRAAVLATLAQSQELAPCLPATAHLSTARILAILEGAGIWSDWQKALDVRDGDLTHSRFYTNRDYRVTTCRDMARRTRAELTRYFAAGATQTAGAALFEEVTKDQGLAAASHWQLYLDVPGSELPGLHGLNPEALSSMNAAACNFSEALAVLIAGFWSTDVIEPVVHAGVDLRGLVPAVTVRDAVGGRSDTVTVVAQVAAARDNPRSAVATLADQGKNARIHSRYAEHGVIRPGGYTVTKLAPLRDSQLVGGKDMAQLRTLALAAQKAYAERIAGQDTAVELVAEYIKGRWCLVDVRPAQA